MKKLLLILLLLPTICFGQFPIFEDFEVGTSWTFSHAGGIQDYGTGETYGTFNIDIDPYPNSSTVTITSPISDLSSCVAGTATITFEININIEPNYDFVHVDYWTGSAWITLSTWTGNLGGIGTFNVPNTATQFRFRLETDGSVNTYVQFGQTQTYYVDVNNFIIDCSSTLPIELSEFSGYKNEMYNLITWTTKSEMNNDYFTLERSTDGINYTTIHEEMGSGNSSSEINYRFNDYTYTNNTINYYRLTQTDFNGDSETFDVISINNTTIRKKPVRIVNILGQEVDKNQKGLVIEIYSDGTTKKVYRQ